MSFYVKILILIGAIASLTACTNFKAFMDKPDAKLLYRHSSPDFIVAWNTLQAGNEAVIDGLITNVKNIQVLDIDLTVVVLNSDGRHLSEGTVLFDKMNLKMNNSVSFSVKLKDAIIAKDSILEFIINYRINTGSWNGRNAQSRFKVDAATGGAIGEPKEE